jgi:hypothetical protein
LLPILKFLFVDPDQQPAASFFKKKILAIELVQFSLDTPTDATHEHDEYGVFAYPHQ